MTSTTKAAPGCLPGSDSDRSTSGGGGSLLEVERALHRVGLIAEVLGVPTIGARLDLASGQIRQALVLLGQLQLDRNLLFDFVRHDGYFNLGV